MDFLPILAQASQEAEEHVDVAALILDVIWKQVVSLRLVEALTFASFGLVCLFYGWRIFKILVTICFGLAGLIAAVWINRTLIEGQVVWLAIILATIFMALSLPLMKWGVSVLGAVAGGVVTSGCWMALSMPSEYLWAGGLVGLVAGGMLSFVVFKAAVMLSTSLGGSALLVTGILAIFYDYLPGPEKLESLVYGKPWFLPAMLLVPVVAGVFLQNKFMKGSGDLSA